MCVICLSSDSEYAFVACGHKVLCQSCLDDFKRHNAVRVNGRSFYEPYRILYRCPLCKTQSSDIIKIFDEDEHENIPQSTKDKLDEINKLLKEELDFINGDGERDGSYISKYMKSRESVIRLESEVIANEKLIELKTAELSLQKNEADEKIRVLSETIKLRDEEINELRAHKVLLERIHIDKTSEDSIHHMRMKYEELEKNFLQYGAIF